MSRRAILPLLAALIALTLPAVAEADFGFLPGSTKVTTQDAVGRVASQAGAHPDSFSLDFELNQDSAGKSEGGELRDVVIDLPPGFVGDPEATRKCSRQEFEGTSPRCPGSSQVGVLRASSPGLQETVNPIYNLEPPPGVAAQLGFALFSFTVAQNASILTDRGYAISIAGPNIPLEITGVNATIWGTPADSSHDSERTCAGVHGCSADVVHRAFLTLPTSCGPFALTVEADSKQNPGVYVSETVPLTEASGDVAPIVGCSSVPFSPAVASAPTAASSDSPSGLGFKLALPNHGLVDPEVEHSETEPKKTELVFPAGLTVNPSAAAGLGACSQAQYQEAACPESAKLGTLTAKTPLLAEGIEGSIYLAKPHENPFNSLLALYIVAKAGERGVLIKQAGKVESDPATGQLTTSFDGLPPLPYSSFEVNLREGPRAPLITPQACGEYRTAARLFPFSAPDSPVERVVPFRITSGANGGACAASEGQLPNRPSFEAGTLVPVAASYSPFVFRVKRSDGDQRFSSVQTTLPTGLVGKLKGIPYCPEAGIAPAASRTQEGGGALELASPSCPAASQVGIVNVAAGAGTQPYTVQGKVYLAGPYKGAPLSLEIITPAIAGPFDLGSVAVRTALNVNPITAQISAVSDPLPSILHGIPLDVRTISLQMDKPDFTLNPTNCSAKTVSGAVTSLVGQSALLSNPFAVGGCKGLEFGPKLALSLSGSTQRAKNPALKAVLTQPAGQANIAKVSVVLPKSEFIDNRHIGTPCTRVQFNAGAGNGAQCPAKSLLGKAKAWTPLLDKPLEGPVYFRSNGGERELPDLVASLDGQVHLNVVGFIDSVHKKGQEASRTRNTFAAVPDAPVSKFVLELSGGKKGLLQNSANLCKVKNVATVKLSAQNGKTADLSAPIANDCKSKGKKKSGKGKGQKHGNNEAKKTSLLRGLGAGW
jgi:hypothetical protein